jgi:hypothetical protein
MNLVFLRTRLTKPTRSIDLDGAPADHAACGGWGEHETCPIPDFVAGSFRLDSFLLSAGNIMRALGVR